MREYTKDPDAVRDYTVEWDLGGGSISTSTFVVESGLTKDQESSGSSSATVRVSGGTLGEAYEVTNRITTEGGETMDYTFLVVIAER